MEPLSKESPVSAEPEDPSPRKTNEKINEKTIEPTSNNGGIFQLITSLFRNSAGSVAEEEQQQNANLSLKQTLQSLLEEREFDSGTTLMTPEERSMLRNMVRFGEMTVSDIMIPRTDIVALEHDSTLEDLQAIIVQEKHSRYPVYKDNLDNILGFVHLKDIAVQLFSGKKMDMEECLLDMLFVPPSMKVMDLLLQMRRAGVHMAIVVDEYGGTDGLVTMENVVEEIVGDIQDEHDEEDEDKSYLWISDNVLQADARMELEKLDDCFNASVVLEEDMEECDTVGGLITARLGHIPEKGEILEYPTGLRFVILEADPRFIKRVQIERLADTGNYVTAGDI